MNSYSEWAARHPQAAADLQVMLGAVPWPSGAAGGEGKPEGWAQQQARFKAAQQGAMAWWVGMQPVDRPLAEKHRRFYYRFGIDIGTAFTLKAADTDALIDRIKQHFSEDIAI